MINLSNNKFNKKIFDCLFQPVITEKTMKLMEFQKYTFDVNAQLNKKQIKKIFEIYFNSKIKTIKTFRIKKKSKAPIKRVIFNFFENKKIFIFNI